MDEFEEQFEKPFGSDPDDGPEINEGSMDLEYEEEPEPRESYITDDYFVSGGVVTKAAAIPVPESDDPDAPMTIQPALIFEFSRFDGVPAPPIMLVLSDRQMRGLSENFVKASKSATRLARKHRVEQEWESE